MDDTPNERMSQLSTLMPLPERFEMMAQAIVARVTASRVRLRDALPAQLLRWAGPALAIGSGLALSLWMIGATPMESSEPTALVSQWALNNEVPAANSILETLEDAHQAEITR